MHIVRIRPEWFKPPPIAGTDISACHVGSPLCKGFPGTTVAMLISTGAADETSGNITRLDERLEPAGDPEMARDDGRFLDEERRLDLELFLDRDRDDFFDFGRFLDEDRLLERLRFFDLDLLLDDELDLLRFFDLERLRDDERFLLRELLCDFDRFRAFECFLDCELFLDSERSLDRFREFEHFFEEHFRDLERWRDLELLLVFNCLRDLLDFFVPFFVVDFELALEDDFEEPLAFSSTDLTSSVDKASAFSAPFSRV